MAALTATDVTVTIEWMEKALFKKRRMAIVALTFGDGALTVPATGIPLPAIGYFGMTTAITDLFIMQHPNGFVYAYAAATHTLMVLAQGVVTGSTTVADATAGALLENAGGAETAFRAMGTAVDTTYNLGPLRPVEATFAPPATTVRALVVGR